MELSIVAVGVCTPVGTRECDKITGKSIQL